jgi:hypothetical protein
MEAGPVKKPVIEKLLQLNIPFVEVGMGVYLRNNVRGAFSGRRSAPKRRATIFGGGYRCRMAA